MHNNQAALKHLLSIVSIQWTRWREEEGNQTTEVSLGKTEQLQSKALLFPIMRRMAWWRLGWGRFMVQCHSGLIASTPLEATANYFAIERKRTLSDCIICIKASHDGLLHPDFSLHYSIICRGGYSVLTFIRSLSFPPPLLPLSWCELILEHLIPTTLHHYYDTAMKTLVGSSLFLSSSQ
jgi:hypothetical protein